jgi:hypothetical protein
MQERDALEVEGCSRLGSIWGRQDHGEGASGKERLQEWKGQAGLKMALEERSLSGLRRLAFPRGAGGKVSQEIEGVLWRWRDLGCRTRVNWGGERGCARDIQGQGQSSEGLGKYWGGGSREGEGGG